MSITTALEESVDKFFEAQLAYRVEFLLSFFAWFMQLMALTTHQWVSFDGGHMGLWLHCNSSGGYECCQSVDNFLGKSIAIKAPSWLTATRVFQIFGFSTSAVFVISSIAFTVVPKFVRNKRLKIFICFINIMTAFFILVGGFIYSGEFSDESWMSEATLSSSFGSCIVSGIFHFICFLLIIITNDNRVADLDKDIKWQGPFHPVGTKEYWEEIMAHPITPSYWRRYEGGYPVQRYLNHTATVSYSKVDKNVYDAIKQVVDNTWDSQHVGIGKDARNIRHTGIQVTDIQRIENPQLWSDYVHSRENLIRKMLKHGHFPKLENRSQKGSPLTSRNVGNELRKDIYPEINEYFFFHGTQNLYVDNIAKQGIDPRFAGNNPMMGRGCYCAESSTKSDQYADNKSQQQTSGLKMFFVRMLLGRMYIASSPKPYKLPPCSNCLQETCSDTGHVPFDSVVADFKSGIFREFIVYERNQCYPEYVIKYDRV